MGSRVHIIEELQIFPHGQPVQNLLLDADRVSWWGSLEEGASVLWCPSAVDERASASLSSLAAAGWKDQAPGISQQKVDFPGAQEEAPWGREQVQLQVVALTGHACRSCPRVHVRTGTALRGLLLQRSPGARRQLQPVPELWGLRPRPGPLLCMEQFQVQTCQPLRA